MPMKLTPLLTLCPLLVLATPAEPKFRLQEIDKVFIGYGLALADVDGALVGGASLDAAQFLAIVAASPG